ncbi:MAG: 30S ribosome-binding factor RbfA [Candidatus Babeliales bacterium]
MSTPVSDIKKAQKEKIIQREVATLFMEAAQDDPELAGIMVTRVELTPDKGMCYIYMYVDGGLATFKEKLKYLKLFKPSLRKSLADALKFRYTPDLTFAFDSQYEKEMEINNLFETLKEKGEL